MDEREESAMIDAFLSGRWLCVGGVEHLETNGLWSGSSTIRSGDLPIWCELCYACVSVVAQLTSMIWYVIWCDMTVYYSLCYDVLHCVLIRRDEGDLSLPAHGRLADEWRQTGSLSSTVLSPLPLPIPIPICIPWPLLFLSVERNEFRCKDIV